MTEAMISKIIDLVRFDLGLGSVDGDDRSWPGEDSTMGGFISDLSFNLERALDRCIKV